MKKILLVGLLCGSAAAAQPPRFDSVVGMCSEYSVMFEVAAMSVNSLNGEILNNGMIDEAYQRAESMGTSKKIVDNFVTYLQHNRDKVSVFAYNPSFHQQFIEACRMQPDNYIPDYGRAIKTVNPDAADYPRN